MRRLARWLFTLCAAVSVPVFVAVYVLSANAYGRQNGHFEAFAFGKPAGPALTWFLFHDLRPLPMTPRELVLYTSMILPMAWLLAATTKAVFARGRKTRGRLGLCPSCGYDLRASPGRCPECGAAAAAASGDSAG